jgi:ABC-type sugar transport system ATPase subunit
MVVVAARKLGKRFPGVVALDEVDFELRSGEVHCLVGENGAGKSTLIKILSGFYAPDEGAVVLDGGRRLAPDTAAAREQGIATIHQEHHLVPHLSVAENVMLGGWPSRLGLISRRALREHAAEALRRVAPAIPLGREARLLSAAEGQLVEIARALAQDARVLIMDEPTTALAEADVERLFSLVRSLRAEGMAVLYVSHKLDEVFALGDYITVLRDGRLAARGPAADFDTEKVVRAMVGEDVAEHRHTRHTRRETVLLVRNLTRRGVLAAIDLTVHAGEIVGLAGLVGSGRSELAMCLFGADEIDDGEIYISGKQIHLASPVDAIRAGIGLVPEERKLQALVEALTVRENLSLGVLDRLSRMGVLAGRQERQLADRFVESLRIRTPGLESRVAGLSGGNQQKVVIARWLAREPRLLILDEPTKGVDVGAKAEIHRLIEQLAGSGVGVLMISSELPELLALSDRMAVMREGRLVAVLDRPEATKQRVMAYATAN